MSRSRNLSVHLLLVVVTCQILSSSTWTTGALTKRRINLRATFATKDELKELRDELATLRLLVTDLQQQLKVMSVVAVPTAEAGVLKNEKTVVKPTTTTTTTTPAPIHVASNFSEPKLNLHGIYQNKIAIAKMENKSHFTMTPAPYIVDYTMYDEEGEQQQSSYEDEKIVEENPLSHSHTQEKIQEASNKEITLVPSTTYKNMTLDPVEPETDFVSFGKGIIFPVEIQNQNLIGEQRSPFPRKDMGLSDNKTVYCSLEVDKRIALNAVGFYGPVNADTYYDIYLKIKKYAGGSWHHGYQQQGKVYATVGDIFYLDLGNPFILEARNEGHKYLIQTFLKGPDTVQNPAQSSTWQSFASSGVNFKVQFYPVTPYAELEFTKIS